MHSCRIADWICAKNMTRSYETRIATLHPFIVATMHVGSVRQHDLVQFTDTGSENQSVMILILEGITDSGDVY